MLVTGGAILLMSDEDTVKSSFLDQSIPMGELPEQSNDSQTSDGLPDSDGMAELPSVPWEEFLPEAQPETAARRAVEYFGAAAIGLDYADVTIVEIGSYGCTACRNVHQSGVLQSLFEEHPDQIRFIFIPWPVWRNDVMATEAVLCAMDQSNEAFWAFHDALLDLTDTQYGRYSTYAHYANIAESIENLDVVQFNECMIDGLHHELVNELLQVGFDLKLRGTPSFFVNGELTSAYSLEMKVAEHLQPELPDTLMQPSESTP